MESINKTSLVARAKSCIAYNQIQPSFDFCFLERKTLNKDIDLASKVPDFTTYSYLSRY